MYNLCFYCNNSYINFLVFFIIIKNVVIDSKISSFPNSLTVTEPEWAQEACCSEEMLLFASSHNPETKRKVLHFLNHPTPWFLPPSFTHTPLSNSTLFSNTLLVKFHSNPTHPFSSSGTTTTTPARRSLPTMPLLPPQSALACSPRCFFPSLLPRKTTKTLIPPSPQPTRGSPSWGFSVSSLISIGSYAPFLPNSSVLHYQWLCNHNLQSFAELGFRVARHWQTTLRCLRSCLYGSLSQVPFSIHFTTPFPCN